MDIALFSPSSLFAQDEDPSPGEDGLRETGTHQSYVERSHVFPGMDLLIREFSFHQLNANLLWPGTFAFAEWLVQNRHWLEGRRIIELGSGTGALAIFLQISFGVDITSSDFNDEELEENIAHNCRINGRSVLPHIRHSWGETFPITDPDWDLIIASDILLYVKQYPNLIKTLSFLLKSYKPKEGSAGPGSYHDEQTQTVSERGVELPCPAFLMSWRRRIGKEEEALFFTGCKEAGLSLEHLGSRVYCISLRKTTNVQSQHK
ncbi:S-adenosyl-L-methionine-dependent methyltransferases superfamily protein [Tasmannia lanceolata]|uniref:S-adenosyl-L-methionine-dependent methyltransferases superfamily protein n=1 Tax=Tasmannia lanceolata TaxID=3420 RepID=UPI004062E983